MKTVYKYNLNFGLTILTLPKNSKILYVAEQYGQLVLYAEVNNDNENIIKTIRVIGTGHILPNIAMKYINTVMATNGLVWHVYSEV